MILEAHFDSHNSHWKVFICAWIKIICSGSNKRFRSELWWTVRFPCILAFWFSGTCRKAAGVWPRCQHSYFLYIGPWKKPTKTCCLNVKIFFFILQDTEAYVAFQFYHVFKHPVKSCFSYSSSPTEEELSAPKPGTRIRCSANYTSSFLVPKVPTTLSWKC